MHAGHRIPIAWSHSPGGWDREYLMKINASHTYLHAYACICMCIYMHVHAYACICTQMHAYACTCMPMHAYACICMHEHAYACICMHMMTYACIRMHMHEHARTWPSTKTKRGRLVTITGGDGGGASNPQAYPYIYIYIYMHIIYIYVQINIETLGLNDRRTHHFDALALWRACSFKVNRINACHSFIFATQRMALLKELGIFQSASKNIKKRCMYAYTIGRPTPAPPPKGRVPMLQLKNITKT